MPIMPIYKENLEQAEEVRERRRESFQEPPRLEPRRLLDEEPPSHPPSRTSFWIAVILLACGLAAASWYGYSRLQEQGGFLNQMNSWKAGLDSIGLRVASVETKLRELPDELAAVTSRVSNLDERVASVRKEARLGVQRLGVSLRREINDANSADSRRLEARIRELNQARHADLLRTVDLERQVSRLRQQVAANSADVAASREIAAHDSRQVRREIEQTNVRVSEAASFNNRPRERFSMLKDGTQQVSSNVLLHITRVDPLHRQFDGWLQLVEEGKFLWLKRQGVLQPFAFHAGPARLRHDLIVTDLSRAGVSGYVILPSVGETNVAQP